MCDVTCLCRGTVEAHHVSGDAVVPREMATISRFLKSIGLFCKRVPLKRLYSARETYNFKAPDERHHVSGDAAECVRVLIHVDVCICLT